MHSDESTPPRQSSDRSRAQEPDAQHVSKPTQKLRHRPLRLLHVMVLVAAVAVTLFIAPNLMQAIMTAYGPASSWNRRMYLVGVTSIALVCWTLILVPFALFGSCYRLRRASRSYGTAAVFAAAAALCVPRGPRFGFAAAAREVRRIDG